MRRWLEPLTTQVLALMSSHAPPYQRALRTSEKLDELLMAFAGGSVRVARPSLRRHPLARFVAELPQGASARARPLEWRRRRSEVKHLIRRGELEAVSAVEARAVTAVLWMKQIARAQIPGALMTLPLTTDPAKVRAVRTEALEAALSELSRLDRPSDIRGRVAYPAHYER